MQISGCEGDCVFVLLYSYTHYTSCKFLVEGDVLPIANPQDIPINAPGAQINKHVCIKSEPNQINLKQSNFYTKRNILKYWKKNISKLLVLH